MVGKPITKDELLAGGFSQAATEWSSNTFPPKMDAAGFNRLKKIADAILSKAPPLPLSQPQLSGSFNIQTMVTASTADYTSPPTSVAMKWYADDVIIPGANSRQYVIQASDYGKTLVFEEIPSNTIGAGKPNRSAGSLIRLGNPANISLNTLSLSSTLIDTDSETGAAIGTFQNSIPTSTLQLIDNAGGQIALSGTTIVVGSTQIDYIADKTLTVVVREILDGSPSSPRDTQITLDVRGQRLRNISPSIAWNGTPGSGFTDEPVVPGQRLDTDPPRPILRSLVPPNQFYNDELLFGVFGCANDNGTLINNWGIKYVNFIYEGTVIKVVRPTTQTFPDANGNPVTYYGWWIKLKKNSAINGHARLYAVAKPNNPAYDDRILGPIQFSPQAKVYDFEFLVNPSYTEDLSVTPMKVPDLTRVFTLCRTSNAQNPRAVITGAPSGVVQLTGGGRYTNAQGYLTIESQVPITFGRDPAGTPADIRLGYDGIHFKGSNIKFDLSRVTGFYHENSAGIQHWFDGISMFTQSFPNMYRNLPISSGYLVRDYPILTECTIDGISVPAVNGLLIRGNTLSNGWADIYTDAQCVVGNKAFNWDQRVFAVDTPSLTVRYTGSGTATLTSTGSKTFTAKLNGTTVGTFTVATDDAAFNSNRYYPSAVVDWINSLGNGWSATWLSDSRPAACLCLPSSKGTLFTNTPITTTPTTLVTMIDLHGDTYQLLTAAVPARENILFAFNRTYQTTNQNWMLGTGNVAPMCDIAFVCNAYDNIYPADGWGINRSLYSQQQGRSSHMLIVHNTLATQGMWVTNNVDSHCLYANNAARVLSLQQASIQRAPTYVNQHLETGATVDQSFIGTTVGGGYTNDRPDNVPNSYRGDFTPAGALRTNLKFPATPVDIFYRPHLPLDCAGAVSLLS